MALASGTQYYCSIEPYFETYTDFIKAYSNNQELVDVLLKEELDRYIFRRYSGEKVLLYVILGSILFDSIIEYSNEVFYSRIRKALVSVQKQFNENNLRIVDMTYRELVEIAKKEKEIFLKSEKGIVKSVFPQIYKRIIENPNYVNALAQSSRVLLIQEIIERPKRSVELNFLLDELVKKFPLLSPTLHYQVLSLFTSVFPIMLQYTQIDISQRKLMKRGNAFKSDDSEASLRVKLLEIRSSGEPFTLVCYPPAKVAQLARVRVEAVSLTTLVDGEEEKSQTIPKGEIASPGQILKGLRQVPASIGENEAEEIVYHLDSEESDSGEKSSLRSGSKYGKSLEKMSENEMQKSKKQLLCVNCKTQKPQDCVFNTSACGHEYCAECLLCIYSFLPLKCTGSKDCACVLDKRNIENFYRGFLQKTSDSVLAQQINGVLNPLNYETRVSDSRSGGDRSPAIELVKCSLCQGAVTSDIIFKNKCNHRYCLYCVQDCEWDKATKCLFKGCHTGIEARALELFIIDQQKKNQKDNYTSSTGISALEEKNMLNCSLCRKAMKPTLVFKNSNCGDLYCSECIKSKELDRQNNCPFQGCKQKINRAALNQFIILSTKEDASIVTETVSCFGCDGKVELTFPRESKPEYCKCNSCKQVNCLKHVGLMKKCYCYCRKCSGTFKTDLINEVKGCKGCGIFVCNNCEKETSAEKPCGCICSICLENKATGDGSIICSNCIENPRVCQICLDDLFDESKIKLKCGHFVCIKCKFESLEIVESNQKIFKGKAGQNGKKENKEAPERCYICDILAGYLQNQLT